ncbi:hypothetical protein DFH06DRAFT_1412299 [Mycena polygramma]|nr:hypothetical protein DFH06DRAFT_1412299 [Mycena polygramma]
MHGLNSSITQPLFPTIPSTIVVKMVQRTNFEGTNVPSNTDFPAPQTTDNSTITSAYTSYTTDCGAPLDKALNDAADFYVSGGLPRPADLHDPTFVKWAYFHYPDYETAVDTCQEQESIYTALLLATGTKTASSSGPTPSGKVGGGNSTGGGISHVPESALLLLSLVVMHVWIIQSISISKGYNSGSAPATVGTNNEIDIAETKKVNSGGGLHATTKIAGVSSSAASRDGTSVPLSTCGLAMVPGKFTGSCMPPPLTSRKTARVAPPLPAAALHFRVEEFPFLSRTGLNTASSSKSGPIHCCATAAPVAPAVSGVNVPSGTAEERAVDAVCTTEEIKVRQRSVCIREDWLAVGHRSQEREHGYCCVDDTGCRESASNSPQAKLAEMIFEARWCGKWFVKA